MLQNIKYEDKNENFQCFFLIKNTEKLNAIKILG